MSDCPGHFCPESCNCALVAPIKLLGVIQFGYPQFDCVKTNEATIVLEASEGSYSSFFSCIHLSLHMHTWCPVKITPKEKNQPIYLLINPTVFFFLFGSDKQETHTGIYHEGQTV